MSVCYRDAWGSTHPDEPGHTFTAENPLVTAENWDWELELGRRIDHGPTLDIRNCKRIFDKPIDGVWGSDHFGVVADLSVQTSSGRPVRLSTKGRRARFWARLTCCSIHWHCGLLGT
jgi:hypothetical protein